MVATRADITTHTVFLCLATPAHLPACSSALLPADLLIIVMVGNWGMN